MSEAEGVKSVSTGLGKGLSLELHVLWGEVRREILADLCRSLSPGVKTPEL